MDFLNIKEQIKDKGFTYEGFGVEVGLTKTSINRIVSGAQTPSFEMLGKFADTLGIEVMDLFKPVKGDKSPKEIIKTIKNAIEDLEELYDL
jgi:transcriptional regulator with XRE-family HTH domain|tara:strand:- start:224 stop:496 length:273 start_codon:yes stop_codon:yes gene_type:complete